jgi:purine-binding chemotaxis protein CheW
MNQPNHFVIFALDKQQYALPTSVVERIVRMVEVTLLPKTPEIVLGVINVQGRIIPVINMRRWLRLPERAISLSDRLIITHSSTRTVALVADTVRGVVDRPEQEVTAAGNIFSGIDHVRGVVKLQDDIIPILDFDRFLSLEEEKMPDDTAGGHSLFSLRRGPG